MFPNIKAEAARGGWKMKDLAKAAGMSTTALYLKMKGEREFKLDEMAALRKILGCEQMTLDELFQRSEA